MLLSEINDPNWVDLWDFPNPYAIDLTVAAHHIDALGHVNNVHYLRWLQQCAWEHSQSLGYSEATMVALDRAMVVRKTTMEYLAAAFAGERLLVGNWITANDGRLRMRRDFQIIRPADRRVLMRAHINYVCMRVSTGKPTRLPAEYVAVYATNVPEPGNPRD